MSAADLRFQLPGEKRLVLIVDDEEINRQILGGLIDDTYDVLYSGDDVEAMDAIWEHKDDLSLVMLDLLMPRLNGLEVLKKIKGDPELERIPVIVLTADQSAEAESLRLGAIDFISRPYPCKEVIKARILRIIELCEYRDIISGTERDNLTGLYNREYFYRYSEQFDLRHKDVPTDAIMVDVDRFHIINERYGRAYGDSVLKSVGKKLKALVRDSGGIVCREGGDKFLVYCLHREDYKQMLEDASAEVSSDGSLSSRIWLRMGVYPCADKSMDLKRRFDRAKAASDTVRGSFTKSVAEYDDSLREAELYAERLIEDFHTAIREKQFKVWFQPKYDIRPKDPVLSSAEALVRWDHTSLGMISPDKFIPLFEKNGLIQELDAYVWRETAAHIKDWKERIGHTVPVSVNVSRVDMYDPELPNKLLDMTRYYGLAPGECLLEITESAYTGDSDQIIQTVKKLRGMGFYIEMDDFGTGYSSLNMISELPIDAIKLDTGFIRNAFNGCKDTRMLEAIIEIADYLDVPVVAEGVEAFDQVRSLRMMGCDIVQGYYFSKPVPAEEFEDILAASRRHDKPYGGHIPGSEGVSDGGERIFSAGKITRALPEVFESIYYVDPANGRYVEFNGRDGHGGLRIRRNGSDFFEDAPTDLLRAVHEDDRERLAASLSRETLIKDLREDNHLSVTYRVINDDEPVYYCLMAVRSGSRDSGHIVIGVGNVDEQVKQTVRRENLNHASDEMINIARALSSDYESIYYIDTHSGSYTEFKTQGMYEKLRIELSGDDFFGECAANIEKVVFWKDREKIRAALNKEFLMKALETGDSFASTYRLIIDGTPTYYRFKAARAEPTGRHIVIGVSNISAQMAMEREFEAAQQHSLTYSRIAQALSQDYILIYYVNTKTEKYVEYVVDSPDYTFKVRKVGERFFEECRHDIIRMVPAEDRDQALRAFDKDNLLNELSMVNTFSVSYRVNLNGEEVYANFKIIHFEDDSHIVIGVRDIGEQVRFEREYENARLENVTYSSIAKALAADYFAIYYVDTLTDRFIEYSSFEEYSELNIEKGGEDFFNATRNNIIRVVYHEDTEVVSSALVKENLLRELDNTGAFTLNYRLMFGGRPTYVSLKATRMKDRDDGRYIVIGVSNVDNQIKREEELSLAREKANRDALTGVKSKHAWLEAEAEINTKITASVQKPFSLAVCDLNGLKYINDTLGHKEGDRYILSASEIICNTFAHSPVFRIGGDEFVVLLTDRDYEHRDALMAELASVNEKNAQNGGVVIASGISDYIPGEDISSASVFERADTLMYRNKAVLKDRKI